MTFWDWADAHPWLYVITLALTAVAVIAARPVRVRVGPPRPRTPREQLLTDTARAAATMAEAPKNGAAH